MLSPKIESIARLSQPRLGWSHGSISSDTQAFLVYPILTHLHFQELDLVVNSPLNDVTKMSIYGGIFETMNQS